MTENENANEWRKVGDDPEHWTIEVPDTKE